MDLGVGAGVGCNKGLAHITRKSDLKNFLIKYILILEGEELGAGGWDINLLAYQNNALTNWASSPGQKNMIFKTSNKEK